MNTYTCPTCNEKMERDLALFIDHTDKHIVDELKKKNPAWITEEGFCPKCLDHYKKAMRGEVDTNLDPGGVLQRAILGLLGFGAAIALFFWLEAIEARKVWRLALFPLILAGSLGYLQAKRKTCVFIAQKQDAAMRRKAQRIALAVAALSVILTTAAFLAP